MYIRHFQAFITHLGLNSMNEAASEGVPMIGIPLFGDQAFNAAIISHKKSGVYVDILDMYTESKGSKVLTDALNKVLHLPEYSQNAKVFILTTFAFKFMGCSRGVSKNFP